MPRSAQSAMILGVADAMRYEAEHEKAHEAQIQAILDTAVEAILTIDERGTVQSFNLAAVRMFGYQPGEVLGRNVSMLMPPPYQGEHDGYLAAYLGSGHKKIIGIGREVQARRKDGSDFPIHLAVSEVRLADRRLFTGFIRDLSEPKRLEREFLHAQKMETVGSLAGGIAHDFNNLLMGILACSRIAREERVDGEQARELFEEIGAAASRGIALTRRLLAFSRRQPVQLRPTSLNGVIRENETMLRQLLGEDIELSIELEPAGAHALADEGLIEQVLINLVVNARDALPAGGRIAVTTRERADPPQVLLEIRDTGTGMTPEVRARIFEPFFSTKGPDKGTGLGLSTVKRIVGELRGTIEVETEPGQGTTFRIGMPRSAGAQAPAPAAAPVLRPADKSRVLVVEDDHLVRASLRRYLDKRGYAVLVAEGPAQALERAGRNAFDVLVTDMILPGAAGNELARRSRALAPACKVVYMSAHPAEVLIEQGRLEPGAAFLEKPFEMTTLDGLLGEVLGASSQG